MEELTDSEIFAALKDGIRTSQIPAVERFRSHFYEFLILYIDEPTNEDLEFIRIYRTPYAGEIRWLLDALEKLFLSKATPLEKMNFFNSYTLALDHILSSRVIDSENPKGIILLEILDDFSLLLKESPPPESF